MTQTCECYPPGYYGPKLIHKWTCPAPSVSARDQLIHLIKELGCRERGEPVTLAGGDQTTVYLDIKGVLDRGSRLTTAVGVLYAFAEQHYFWEYTTAIGGPTMGADALSHAMVLYNDHSLKWFSVRDRAKTDHGLGRWIEGATLGPDDRVIITDDVASTGKSLMHAYRRVKDTGATVLAVMPLIDRSGKAGAEFTLLGIPYRPLLYYTDLGLPAL